MLHLIKQIGEHKTPTAKEVRDLAARYKAGDQSAREELIIRNVPLAVRISVSMVGAHHSRLADVIGCAVAGLIIAVDKYDHTKGFRFSTYAQYWIRQQITVDWRANRSTVRLPAWLHDALDRSEAGKSRPKDNLDLMEKGRRALRMGSLDIRIEPKMPPLGESLPAPPASDPVVETELRQRLAKTISFLDPEESAVIRMRYGLNSEGREYFHHEIAKILGVPREHSSQIEARALQKIRDDLTDDDDEL